MGGKAPHAPAGPLHTAQPSSMGARAPTPPQVRCTRRNPRGLPGPSPPGEGGSEGPGRAFPSAPSPSPTGSGTDPSSGSGRPSPLRAPSPTEQGTDRGPGGAWGRSPHMKKIRGRVGGPSGAQRTLLRDRGVGGPARYPRVPIETAPYRGETRSTQDCYRLQAAGLGGPLTLALSPGRGNGRQQQRAVRSPNVNAPSAPETRPALAGVGMRRRD